MNNKVARLGCTPTAYSIPFIEEKVSFNKNLQALTPLFFTVDDATESDQAIDEGTIRLDNKKDMHLMNASMFETIRLTCSPIVPHQATRDSTVGGK